VTAALIVLGIAVVVLLIVTLRLARRGRAARSDEKAQAWAPSIPAPTANVAVVTRYERWMGRVEQEKLGARDETWADLPETPQYATWQRLAEARGAPADVRPYMTHGLLAEVLFAAGGVERELRELRKAVGDGQRAAQEPRRPSVLIQVQQQASAPQSRAAARAFVSARPVREASYSFVNLLSWARATVERTDRPYQPGSSGRAGLLPALRPGELHDSVEAALQHLRTALLDSRSLSSYAFHAGAVPGDEKPGSGRLPDGDTLAPPAYSLTKQEQTVGALQFTEERDMLTYATDLMAAIEVFVNRVLDAFAASRTVSR
jgi:hypothetical protein